MEFQVGGTYPWRPEIFFTKVVVIIIIDISYQSRGLDDDDMVSLLIEPLKLYFN